MVVPLIVLAFVLVSFDPPMVLFSLFLVYAVSGYVMWALLWYRARPPAGRRPPPAAPLN
jgi:CDP-diacylglycerol--serine O-phosphatidyltransferase